MKEIWKEAMRFKTDNYPESTEAIVYASNLGNLKRSSYKFWNHHNQGYSLSKGLTYSLSSNRGKQRFEEYNEKKGKYLSACIGGKARSVHRLVAGAFIPNENNLPQVNHKNGNRSDNRPENLEWVTNQQNRAHAAATGLNNGEKLRKLTDYQITESIKLRKKGMTTHEIGEIYNVSHECIRLNTNELMSDYEIRIVNFICHPNIRNSKKFNFYELENIINKFKDGARITDITKEFKCAKGTAISIKNKFL